LLTTPEIAQAMKPGTHAATYGGNPLAARAGIAALEMIEEEKLLERGAKLGELFRSRFEALEDECELIRDVRVLGTMVGVELACEGAPIVKKCLERKLLINCTQGTVIRLLPPLTLTDEQAHEGCDILAEALREQTV
jgi:acetylornithine/N-succinyldiaminopimelate aminotransferase